MNELKRISVKLKEFEIKDKQKKYLNTQLRGMNKWIDEQVRRVAQKVSVIKTRSKYQGGIVFPYSSGDERDPYVIANIIPELAVVFETKERAPFKVVFESLQLLFETV